MCDYCGCRTNPTIRRLGEEHDVLRDLSGRVRRAFEDGDAATARRSFETLASMLREHLAAEEAGVLAQLRQAGEFGDHVEELEAEHRRTLARLDRIDGVDEPSADVVALLDDLHDHISREEYDLFPASMVALSAARWEAAMTGARGARAEFAERRRGGART